MGDEGNQEKYDISKMPDNIHFLYIKLIDLYLSEKRLISERNTIFLAFNSLIFIAFIQVLFYLISNPDKLGEGYIFVALIALIIPLIALFTCILQKYNIKCAIDSSNYWKDKILDLELDDAFLPILKKRFSDSTSNVLKIGLFNDKKKYVENKYVSISPIDLFIGKFSSRFDLDIQRFNPNSITQMWQPFAISLVWIFALASIMFFYNNAYLAAFFLLVFDMALIAYLKGDLKIIYWDNIEVKKFLNAIFLLMTVLLIPAIILFLIGFLDFMYQLWNSTHLTTPIELVISKNTFILLARTTASSAFVIGSLISSFFYFFGKNYTVKVIA